ncbi:hypothetical protein T07_3855 [Trichinella nelsoni]|uniref:CGG triplet repeat-binding protein 1 n=1 Tax=Trichinella nelsoni TaxID=6336 RepID=A0A0V0RUE8_9BILA|nr:hypothetical protein T07_3855 [Trichinella nelsoni]
MVVIAIAFLLDKPKQGFPRFLSVTKIIQNFYGREEARLLPSTVHSLTFRLLCRSYPRSTTSSSFKIAKVKSKPSKKLIDLVKEYGSDILSTDNTVLFCKACGKTINHEKRYFVYQYMQITKHKSATEKMKTESKQACLLCTFVADSSSKSQIPTDLCMAFTDAGIPLWILENKSLRGFLEKYTKQHIPNETIDPVGKFCCQCGHRYTGSRSTRCLFSDVDRLISSVKKNSATSSALPLTRWGTWLSAVFYYAANLTKIQEIIGCFEEEKEEEESAAVKIVHEIMQKESLRCDLVCIASNFANFIQAITFFEKRSETLVDKLQVFDKVSDDIHKIPGKVGEDIQRKCDKLISANKDLKEIQSIAEVFKGKSNAQLIGMNIESAVCFKYAPVTSAEVERNFSQLKYILSDR